MPCSDWHEESSMDAQSAIAATTGSRLPNIAIAPTRAGNAATEAATTKVKMVRTRDIRDLCVSGQYPSNINLGQVTDFCTPAKDLRNALPCRISGRRARLLPGGKTPIRDACQTSQQNPEQKAGEGDGNDELMRQRFRNIAMHLGQFRRPDQMGRRNQAETEN